MECQRTAKPCRTKQGLLRGSYDIYTLSSRPTKQEAQQHLRRDKGVLLDTIAAFTTGLGLAKTGFARRKVLVHTLLTDTSCTSFRLGDQVDLQNIQHTLSF